MEIAYCDGCGFKLTAGELANVGGKTLCARCRVQSAATPKPGTLRSTPGSGNRRMTPAAGLARPVGTPATGNRRMTPAAGNARPAATPAGGSRRPRPKTDPNILPRGGGIRHIAPPVPAPRSNSLLYAALAGLALILVMLFSLRGGGGAQVASTVQPKTVKVTPVNQPTTPAPNTNGGAQPTPVTPETTPRARPDGEDRSVAAQREKAAETIYETLTKFDGLADDDTEGRLKKLDEFVHAHGQTLIASRARALKARLLEETIQKSHNYALAANGAKSDPSDTNNWLIDGDGRNYDAVKGLVAFPLNQPAMITLKESVELNHIRMMLYAGDDRRYNYKIEVSPDDAGTAWTTVADMTAEEKGSTGWQNLHFAPQKAKLIRITGTRNTANPWIHIIDVQAYMVPLFDKYMPKK